MTSKRCRDPKFNKPGRHVNPMSRPASAPPTECPCRDPKPWSRHQVHHKAARTMSRHQIGVATPFLLPSLKPGHDIKTRSRPSWRLTYVATSNPCRDLPHCRPCRDIKSMSRRRFCQQWDFQVATPKPGRNLPHCYPCRDLKNDVATSTQPHFCYVVTPFFHVATSLATTHVVTSK